jgi:hypothetical protein
MFAFFYQKHIRTVDANGRSILGYANAVIALLNPVPTIEACVCFYNKQPQFVPSRE